MKSISKNIFIIFFLFLINDLYGQCWSRQREMTYEQGHVIEQLSSKGANGETELDIMNVNAGNPAALCYIQGFELGISYQYNSKIQNKYTGNNKLYRSNYYPQSIGLSYSINNFNIGLGIDQKYSITYDSGIISNFIYYSRELGDIELDPFYAGETETLIKNSLLFSYQFQKILPFINRISFGYKTNYNLFYRDSFAPTWYYNYNSLVMSNFNYEFGILIDLSIFNKYNFKLGLHHESKFELEKKFYSNPLDCKHIVTAIIPERYNAGIAFAPFKSIILRTGLSFVNWESITNSMFDEKNQIEIANSVSYLISKKLFFTIGTFYTNQKFSGYFSRLNGSYVANYQIIGYNYKHNEYTFDFTIADNHLISSERRKHTIFKVGLGYSFNK